MLKWLFGRKQEATQKNTSAVPAATTQQPTPVAETTQSESTATVASAPIAPEPAPQSAAPSPPAMASSSATSQPTPKTVLLKHSLSLLADEADIEPKVGLDAVAVAPPVVEAAKVVKVQAGGRRVVASFGNSAKVRVYSKRADGTYRLEGAPAQSASRLIVGATA